MWKKIVLGLVIFIGVVLALVMVMTAGMTDTAESFFESVAAKQYDKAYSYLSEDFTRSISKEQLIAYMERTGLQNYRDVSWGNRSVEGKRGEIEGTVETLSGGAIPITVKCIKKSDGSWRIYAINKPASGIVQKETAEPVMLLKAPDTEKAIKLVKETMRHFAHAVNQKDMTDLHAYAAAVFQKQVSVEKLNNAFKSFMETQVDFTVLDRMNPHLDFQPKIKEGGTLILEGTYSTSPSKVYFVLKYSREKEAWKLVGINVEVK